MDENQKLVPDLFAIISEKEPGKEEPRDVTINFRASLLALFDKMMNEAGITDTDKLQRLAFVRSRIDILLRDF